VTRLVVAVVVNAIQGQPMRTFAHVGEKIGEVAPVVANRYAASSVLGMMAAPVPHIFPRLVRWADRLRGQAVAVFEKSLARLFRAVTAAGFGVTAPQFRGVHFGQISAVAEAQPCAFSTFVPGRHKGEQSSGTKSGYIDSGTAHLISPWLNCLFCNLYK